MSEQVAKKQRWLKRADGLIFPWNENKAAHPGLVECDENGIELDVPPVASVGLEPLPADPAVAAETARMATSLQEAKAELLNLRIELADVKGQRDVLQGRLNALLEEFTAKEDEEVSPEDEKTWQENLATPEVVLPPALRDPFDTSNEHFSLEEAIASLPSQNVEAKKVLAKLASDLYGVDIDKRMGLPKLIDAIRELEKRAA